MKRLILKLLLSEREDIEAEVINSPAGSALKSGNLAETEKPSGVSYRELKSHKNTLLKALDVSSFQEDVFSVDEQSWLIENKLLDNEKTRFLSLQKNVGYMLYQALFHSNKKAEVKLHDSRMICHEERLHVQLLINADDERSVRLFDYPWELLHDGEKFLLTQRKILFSRYIAYGEPLPELYQTKKLQVLLVSLNAFDGTMGLYEISTREHDEIRKRLEAQQSIHLTTLIPSSFREFGEYLARLKAHEMPHVIHFHGHGLFGMQCIKCKQTYIEVGRERCVRCNGSTLAGPQGYLLFKNEDQWVEYVSTERLSAELGVANLKEGGKQQDRIALVVLSACQSGLALSNPSIFNGMTQSLIDVGIPAVVGMQFSVAVSGAANFAERFYSSLGQNPFLFEAMANGIVGMNVEGDQWYRPVLYTRWQGNENGQLFTPTSSTTEPTGGDPPSDLRSSSGTFSERVDELHTQIQEKSNLLTEANAVFDGEGIWWDVCDRALILLQEVSGSIQEFSSWIDKADIGELTEKENQLRNTLKKPAHDCKGTLDDLIFQVNGLISLLKNRASTESENFDARKSEYLNTIRSKFTMLKKNLDQLHNGVESR